ncbi:class I SAM-dependent methyltransferase [archaeon]|nr:class I SAM-dependent methyltransferase [archaeon]
MAENNAVEHYYTEKPTSKIKEVIIEDVVLGNKLVLLTSSGLFSPKRIDKGTKVLIENAVINPDWTVLDLGCGYGVVGISIKKKFPETKVTLLDVNERALTYSKKNAERNKVEVTTVNKLVEEKFNTILLNPPQSAGKKICFELFELSKKHLENKGIFQIVARHKKGGRTFENKMKELFGNVKTIAKESGYRVYVSEK